MGTSGASSSSVVLVPELGAISAGSSGIRLSTADHQRGAARSVTLNSPNLCPVRRADCAAFSPPRSDHDPPQRRGANVRRPRNSFWRLVFPLPAHPPTRHKDCVRYARLFAVQPFLRRSSRLRLIRSLHRGVPCSSARGTANLRASTADFRSGISRGQRRVRRPGRAGPGTRRAAPRRAGRPRAPRRADPRPWRRPRRRSTRRRRSPRRSGRVRSIRRDGRRPTSRGRGTPPRSAGCRGPRQDARQDLGLSSPASGVVPEAGADQRLGQLVQPETAIGTPLSRAPPPRSAVKSSPLLGSKTTPATTTPLTSAAMDTDHCGSP